MFLNEDIDMVVYSMKDMFVVLFEGFVIGCIFEWEDLCDVFILKNYVKFLEMKEGVVIGISSLRRSV